MVKVSTLCVDIEQFGSNYKRQETLILGRDKNIEQNENQNTRHIHKMLKFYIFEAFIFIVDIDTAVLPVLLGVSGLRMASFSIWVDTCSMLPSILSG